jgi:hypothetical protein
MTEREYNVTAIVRVVYLVDAESPEAAAEIVRGYRDDELDDPAQAIDLIEVEETECYEEASDAE